MDVTRNEPLSLDDSAFAVSTTPNSVITNSVGKFFSNPRNRASNSSGFFSDFDYFPGDQEIVVIGDSFVEAMQVPFSDTFHQIVGSQMNQKVYNFGISGAPLSQYEAYAQEICNVYKPKKLIITIIENDFDESLYESRKRNGFFHYYYSGELKATPNEISLIRRIVTKSNIVRYLYFHLALGENLNSFLAGKEQKKNNISIQEKPSLKKQNINEADAKVRSTNFFLEGMSNLCLEPKNIIFVVDANRNDDGIYGENIQLEFMNRFSEKARNDGFSVIELREPMRIEYYEKGERFEYLHDSHWNKKGHLLVANQIILFLQTFK